MQEFAPGIEGFKSKRLHMLLDTFPDIQSKVDYFNGAFDLADVDVDCMLYIRFCLLGLLLPLCRVTNSSMRIQV